MEKWITAARLGERAVQLGALCTQLRALRIMDDVPSEALATVALPLVNKLVSDALGLKRQCERQLGIPHPDAPALS